MQRSTAHTSSYRFMLNLRSRPDTSAPVIANLPDGAGVTVYGEWQGWYTLHFGDLIGYAAAAFIDL